MPSHRLDIQRLQTRGPKSGTLCVEILATMTREIDKIGGTRTKNTENKIPQFTANIEMLLDGKRFF